MYHFFASGYVTLENEKMAKRKADWISDPDIFRNVRQQLGHEINEHKPLGPLTDRSVMFPNDGSATRSIGSSSRVADMSNLARFAGLDPSTREINTMAKLNIRGGQVNRPANATRVLVSDDADMSYGPSANDQLVFAMNALPVGNNFSFTWKCLGIYQILFVFRPSRTSLQLISRPETSHDAKFCSVSMLNAIFAAGFEKDTKQVYVGSRKQDMTRDWSLYGAVQAVEPINDGRLNKLPLVTFVKFGVAKVINYWAACIPRVCDLAYCWFVFVRRPKDPKAAGWYSDMVNVIRDVHLRDINTKESRELVKKAQGLLVDWDLAHDDADSQNQECIWRWEPHVEHVNREPPTYVWQGANWIGEVKCVGRVVSGASALDAPAAYTTTVMDILCPDIDHLDKYEAAIAADTGSHRGVPPLQLCLLGY
jgi:hypothetical protein